MTRWITIVLWTTALNLLAIAGAEAQSTGNTERSGNGTNVVSLSIVNQTGQTVSVFWVDQNGVERGYGTIAPDASFRQQTYNSQVWRFKVGNQTIHTLRTMDSTGAPGTSGAMEQRLMPDMLNKAPSQGRTDSGSSPSVGNTGSNLTSAEANELVEYHNKVRRDVGVGPVKWSPALAKYAQEWADEVARTGKLDHRQEHQYGENMAWGNGSNYGVLTGAEGWYKEKQFYSPGTPFPEDFASFKAGHYTQMVWKDTTEIGAGKAVIQQGDWKGSLIIVCNYNPPGNMTGQKPY